MRDRAEFLEGCVPWPPDFAARYRSAGFWRGEPLGASLSRLAHTYGSKTALVDDVDTVSYRALDERSTSLSYGLRNMGIGPDDRVVVQLPNRVVWYEVCFALWKLGAIPILAQPAHRAHEICSFIRQTQARAYVIPDHVDRFDYRELADSVRKQTDVERVIVCGEPGAYTSLDALRTPLEGVPLTAVDASRVALLQLSGGSTGVPKLIPRTHDDYLYSVRQSVEVCGWRSDVVFATPLPCAHNFPLSSPGALGALLAGGTVLLLPTAAPNVAAPLLTQHGATAVALVPALAQLWSNASLGFKCPSSLRMVQVGGAKLDERTARHIDDWSHGGLQQVFGMAEGLVNYTRSDDPLELKLSTQGRPMSPADELRIVDDQDRPVQPGAVGHLLTRGPYTIRGYYRAAEHNRHAFTSDGFYRTGDLVRQLPSGHLIVEGRAKDQINRGGEKIAAQEVESLLRQTGLVSDAALVAVPDPFLGEKSCAFVCSDDPNLTAEQLRQALRQLGVAAYKLPDRVVWVAELPRTPIGKVDKIALKMNT